MLYCRKCGTKLGENARYCYKCGTPVQTYGYPTSSQPIHRSIREDPVAVGAIVLVAILVTAVVVAAVVFAPFQPYSFSTTNRAAMQPGVNTLNMTFEADTAHINIITQNFTSDAVVLLTSGTGSISIGSSNPVQVAFTNETEGETLNIKSKVTTPTPFGTGFRVTCNLYLNPSMHLNLNVTAATGQVALTANQTVTFQSLNLKSTTGEVEVNLQNVTSIAGDMSLQTTAGTVSFNLNGANVQGNRTFNLQTTTGSVNIGINEKQAFQGNVQLQASTTVGSVDLSMQIDDGVATRIISKTNLGSVNVDVSNFSGNKSPIQSDNYPAQSNFQISLDTDVGSISVRAVYHSQVSSSTVRN